MREILRADKGYIYTNGEIYGTIIYLAIGANKDRFYQITLEEYEKLFEEGEEEIDVLY